MVKREPMEDRIFNVVNILVTIIGIIIYVYPLIFIVSASISEPIEVSSGRMWLFPKKLNFEGYRLIFSHKDIWTGYGNTIIYTVLGTILNLLFTLPCAYSLYFCLLKYQ